jgi:hypothetical protein
VPFSVVILNDAVDSLGPTPEFACCDKMHCSFGELVELVKFALTVMVAVMHLHKHARRQITS